MYFLHTLSLRKISPFSQTNPNLQLKNKSRPKKHLTNLRRGWRIKIPILQFSSNFRVTYPPFLMYQGGSMSLPLLFRWKWEWLKKISSNTFFDVTVFSWRNMTEIEKLTFCFNIGDFFRQNSPYLYTILLHFFRQNPSKPKINRLY